MLEVLSKFICSTIMALTAFYIVKKITNSEEKLLILRSVGLIFGQSVTHLIIHDVNYSIFSIIISFFVNIIFLKLVFKLSIEEAFISCSLYIVILFFADVLGSIITRIFFSLKEIRTGIIIPIFSNVIVSLLSIIIINVKAIKHKCTQFYNFSKRKNQIVNGLFIVLIISLFIFLGYNATNSKVDDIRYSVNIFIMIIISIITYNFIIEKVKYNQLCEEYNTMFSYIQNFEEWIEKEQINRHEYKNQLAMLRSITSDKSVINKINGILNDNVNIKGDTVHKLKELPKGGLKGLMYYKVAIAQKQNVNVEVDISIKKKSIFNKLNESKIKVLCNLIGIYFDNAIEASLETKKKVVSLEIYEINNGVKIVISNTFKRSENFEKRNEKGITTKGQGRGNGLYYANNLISKNNWLETDQEINNDYYIQNIFVKKLD